MIYDDVAFFILFNGVLFTIGLECLSHISP
jgi:hypothetical protein